MTMPAFLPITIPSAGVEVAIAEDRKASGTVGGTFTQGAWRVRDLNTLTGDSICTLATNTITITSAGTYLVSGYAMGRRVQLHKARLLVNGATPYYGSSQSANTSSSDDTPSFVFAHLALSASDTIVLEHYCTATNASNGFGNPVGIVGVDEIYSQVVLIKIA